MKEVAFELDSVGYSYMKMEMWIVEGIAGKIKQKQRNPHLHPESSELTLVLTVLWPELCFS